MYLVYFERKISAEMYIFNCKECKLCMCQRDRFSVADDGL